MKITTGNAMPENGFSLVEILVALFVLVVGVTGAVAMQLTALRTTQQTQLHTQALYLASEMADSIRSKMTQMSFEELQIPYLQSDADGALLKPSPLTENCYQIDYPCDQEQLARFDVREWLLRLQQALPHGRARICRDAAIWNEDAEKINWPCDDSAANAPLVVKLAWRRKSEANAGETDVETDTSTENSAEANHNMSVIAFIVSSGRR
jgi:type IV pilus assembly protein PilV